MVRSVVGPVWSPPGVPHQIHSSARCGMVVWLARGMACIIQASLVIDFR